MSTLTHTGSVAILGLGFGDEGKGASIDALTRQRKATVIIRFNGGSQAAHHVVTPGGKVHCFSLFGSGTLAGAHTHLSNDVVVDPIGLQLEADALEGNHEMKDPLGLVHVDPKAILTTPFHKLLGRVRELARGQDRHGSCGKGIGIAWLDQQKGKQGITWGDIQDGCSRQRLAMVREEKLAEVEALREHVDAQHRALLQKVAKNSYLDDLNIHYRCISAKTLQRSAPFRSMDPSKVLFEGAQGALLDADLGFFPYVSPSFTGAKNALALAQKFGWDPPLCIGVLRAYSSRHGAGPFVVGDRGLTEALPEAHNETGVWQGPMRVGWFDAVAARYGIEIAGKVDGLMITHLDRLAGRIWVGGCERWRVSLSGDFPQPYPSQSITSLPRLAGTLAQRAEWTAQLSRAFPDIREMSGWKDRQDPNIQKFLDWIHEELKTPILGTAFGPSSTDQVWS